MALLLCSAAAHAYALQTDYFPLNPGNIWIFRCKGACGNQPTVTVVVGSTQNFNGTTYSQLQGWFGNNYWVREDSSGSVWAYDQTTQQESLWYAFGALVGSTYSESIPSACCGQATLESTSAAYEGPIGSYDTGLEIDYPGVSQAGVYSELFLPSVGLVSRLETVGSSAEQTYDLIYSRLGGVTIVSQPEISIGLALDHSVYRAANSPTLTARLSIRNSTADPVVLIFPTAQTYDLQIQDAQGNVVYQWSTGKVFAQIVVTMAIQNEKDYLVVVPLANLSPGSYVARWWLVTSGPLQAYSASISFQVKFPDKVR